MAEAKHLFRENPQYAEQIGRFSGNLPALFKDRQEKTRAFDIPRDTSIFKEVEEDLARGLCTDITDMRLLARFRGQRVDPKVREAEAGKVLQELGFADREASAGEIAKLRADKVMKAVLTEKVTIPDKTPEQAAA